MFCIQRSSRSCRAKSETKINLAMTQSKAQSKIYLYVQSIWLAQVSTIEPCETEARKVEILQVRSVEVSKPSTFYYRDEGLWWRRDDWCDIHQSRSSMSESYFHYTHNVADNYLISLSLAVCVYIAWVSASLLAICCLRSVCLRGRLQSQRVPLCKMLDRMNWTKKARILTS